MRFVFASLFCITTFAATPAQLLDTIPIRFEPDRGQLKNHAPAAPSGEWSAHGAGYAFSFTDRDTWFRAGGQNVKLTFPGAKASRIEATDRAPVATNYFLGKKYVSVPGFRRLRRSGVYPGIDVVYYGKGRQLEYDFEVAPGADPSNIRMRFEGADSIHLNGAGGIVLTLADGEVTQFPPVVYQRTEQGGIIAVESQYLLDQDGTVRIKLAKYNPAEKLVIDPAILYAGYFSGSTGPDVATAIAHDAHGNVYLAGYAYSVNFPIVGNAENNAETGDRDLWVMQISMTAPPAQSVMYSSYVGGTLADDLKGMTVDANGMIYLTGSTASINFPVTSGAYISTETVNTHAFVTVLDPTQLGTAGLVYSSYLGGSGTDDEATGIAVAGGKVYLTGFTNSSDFPVVGAYQSTIAGSYNAFAAEIDPTKSGAASLVASTYLGGAAVDFGRAIAVDAAGKVYVAGSSYSANFPVTGTAYQPNYNMDGDAFLAKLDFGAQTLLYSTYLGGSSIDEIKKIAIDPAGRVALTGYTLSPDFPTLNAFQPGFGGNGNAFLTILDSTKAGKAGLAYSTFYGGNAGEVAYDLRLDTLGRYYLGGYTLSPNLPVTSDAMNPVSKGAGVDGFIAVIDPTAGTRGLVYASYVTGLGSQVVYGVDVVNAAATVQVFITGATTSNVFPPGAATNFNIGNSVTFFLGFSLPAPASTSKVRTPLTTEERRESPTRQGGVR